MDATAVTDNVLMTGPFTKQDRSGLDATTLRASIAFPPEGAGQDREFDNEIGILILDKDSGEPLEVVHYPSFHTEFTYAAGAVEAEDGFHLAGGGKFADTVSFPETVIKEQKELQKSYTRLVSDWKKERVQEIGHLLELDSSLSMNDKDSLTGARECLLGNCLPESDDEMKEESEQTDHQPPAIRGIE